MQFKRHWGGQMGHTPIYRREDAACQWIEIDMLKLAVGLATDSSLEDLGLENGKYIRLPYTKLERQ